MGPFQDVVFVLPPCFDPRKVICFRPVYSCSFWSPLLNDINAVIFRPIFNHESSTYSFLQVTLKKLSFYRDFCSSEHSPQIIVPQALRKKKIFKAPLSDPKDRKCSEKKKNILALILWKFSLCVCWSKKFLSHLHSLIFFLTPNDRIRQPWK